MGAPAAFVTVPLLIGVVAGSLGGSQLQSVALAALATCWVATGVSFWRQLRLSFLAAAGGGFLAAGTALGAHATRVVEQPSVLAWYQERPRSDPVRAVGVLRADASRTAGGVSLTVDFVSVERRLLDGGARITVAGALAAAASVEMRAGRTVEMDVQLREPLDYRNPGVPSDRARLARQGIVLTGSVKSAALMRVIARGSLLQEAAAALRARVRVATAASVGRWSARSAGVVTAILIGDRSGLDVEDERRLQEAGTYHVIAISGGNIALLTALLVLGGRAARLPARATAAASILLLAFYGYAAGLAPSVLRATLAGVVYLAARAVDHRGSALNALGVAASVAAIASPLTVLDPGFVLSFGATVAIVTGASRLVPAFPREHSGGRVRKWRRYVFLAVAALCAATICAEIALAPIGARLFGRVSFAGLLLNFLAIPLMSIIQVAGLVAVAAMAVSRSLAVTFGWAAHAGTTALLESAALVDVAPWLVVDLPPPAWWVILLWYLACIALMTLAGTRARLGALVVAGLAATLMLSAPRPARATVVPTAPPGWTRVVFLDVGQGDATLILPAGGAPLLVDAGGVPGSAFDVGRRVTLPAAWAFGVRRLGRLVLTHGDPDHIGGAPAMMRALDPREIRDGIPVPRHEPMRKLREAADRSEIRWTATRAGQTFVEGVATFRVLSPPDPDWERPRVRNDDSIVLEARIGAVAFLLPGDITRALEPAVIAGLVHAPLTIVKAPHHGSAGSSTQAFVDAVRPAAVIFSAGRRNPFGHPAPVVVNRYRAAGAQVFSTADDGATVMETDGKSVVVWTWGSGKRTSLPRPAAETRHGGGTKTTKITKATKNN
jgi:competence protein ComEC